jgi:hypothetical protein
MVEVNEALKLSSAKRMMRQVLPTPAYSGARTEGEGGRVEDQDE